MPYFVQAKLSHTYQGPEKKYPALTGFDLVAKTGHAYEARKMMHKGHGKGRHTLLHMTTSASIRTRRPLAIIPPVEAQVLYVKVSGT